ncbi:hypothetical protein [Acidicapsa ligni]|uniref:hypothetical protein n=1 Tax=Acidicapsa ligni TaxID=542300 RepID=UPI0021DFD46E|nr:hypothetical protein [Acidicapsa ligni]
MADHTNMKLGRKSIRTDSRTLQLGKYIGAGLPAAPAAADWTKGIQKWGMMLNDKLGDCTIASVAHAVQVWSANTAGEITVPDAQVLEYFEQWDGYKPSDPSTDAGGVELNVLTRWRKGAFDTHKLIAFADVAITNLEEVRQAIHLFGGVYIGVGLPITAQTQDVWDVVKDGGAHAKAGSWGGHAVFVPKYDAHGFTCITWGATKTMTNAFWEKYVDEAHALLSHDWLARKGAPSGFKLDELKADLALIH